MSEDTTLREALKRIEGLTGAPDGPAIHGEATWGRQEVRTIAREALAAASQECEPEWEYRAVWYSHYSEMEERSHPISEDGARGIARNRNGRVERRVKAEWQRIDDKATE